MKKFIIQWVMVVAMVFVGSGTFSQTEKENQINASKIPPLSVQLWSVKNQLKVDFEGTLKKLAEMGFEGVEFAGFYDRYHGKGTELKELLNSMGLKASAAHVSWQEFAEDKFSESVTFYKDLGVDTVIVAWDDRAWNKDKINELVKDINHLSEKLSAVGIKFGFHNHDKEFNAFNDSTFWDFIAQNTPQTVVLQLDVAWVYFAGKDPVEYVRRYQGRTELTHYKVRLPDHVKDKEPFVGEDVIDWQSLLKANITVGDTRWITVEQEDYPNDMTELEAVAKSKAGIDREIARLITGNSK